jgi:hypothetical protein
MKKQNRIIVGIAFGLGIVSLLVIAFRFHFNEIGRSNRMTLYAESETASPAADTIMKRVDALISRSGLFVGTKKKAGVYLMASHGTYACVALTARQAFAVNNWLGIFISKSNAAEDSVWRNGDTYNRRRLSCVIAHELVHNYLAEELGFFRYRFSLPSWKNEGLADYVAGESSFPFEEGMRLMHANAGSDSNSFLYFKYRIITAYVLEEERLSLQQFLADPNSFDYWLARFQKRTAKVKS